MVCEKCEAKLGKLSNPDTWKDGARNTVGGKDGGKKVGPQNSLLTKIKPGFDSFGIKCDGCK